MKKFKFNLEPVLRYRKHIEMQKKQELSLAMKKLSDCEQETLKFQDKYLKLNDDFGKNISEGIDGNYHSFFNDYLLSLSFDIELLKAECVKLEKDVFNKKQIVLSKQKERKVVDKFKERKKKIFYNNMIKLEQKEADEMLIVKKAREEKYGV